MRAARPFRICIALAWTGMAIGTAQAAAPRAQALARFDSGYAQCEERHADMRGQGDRAYAGLYRLKLDDALRAQFAQTRRSAAYKREHRRAAQKLQREAAASAVAEKLELQCQALRSELAKLPTVPR